MSRGWGHRCPLLCGARTRYRRAVCAACRQRLPARLADPLQHTWAHRVADRAAYEEQLAAALSWLRDQRAIRLC